LISVVALPAVWAGGEPAEIVRTLLEVLLGMLNLDFAYARLGNSSGEQAVEVARISQTAKLPSRPEEIGGLLKNQLGPDPQNWTPLVRNSDGVGPISIVPMRLGLRGDIGVVAVGARRADFPGPTERLVLSVAANQAAIGLQEARLLSEQKRVASELDRHVLLRTAELAAANEELKKEVAERARVQAEFAHAARISMLGELAASIAHEINQPLAAMRTNGETALRWLDRAEPNVAKARDLTQLSVDAARRATDIISRIRTMAAGRVPEQTKLSLHDVIEESLVFLRGELQSNAVSVIVNLAPTTSRVIGDRIQLQQVIVNLTMNAVHAMARSPSATRTLLIRTQLSAAETLSCTFEDSGSGIDPLYLDRLFDSFFTTKDAGMGMGLPVSRSIIEAHGGVIKADNNSELGGARFSFALRMTR
jgi:C4-dicarboxylate-specific signal transduction histidine kinase